jgi:uncharacterized membrane protein YkgB
MTLKFFDRELIYFFRKISLPFARFGMFVIFFWFGLLKVIGMSPASGLVQSLFENTIPFMSFDLFLILFGLFEMVIGLLFLWKGLERIVIPLLFLHMITTFMPLIFIPEATWTSFMVPTLEGQYIIKNLALMAVACGIAAHLHPAKNINDMV